MRNQKGITLIALVITIIVLLILAGVSIAMLTGSNGILTQANNAGTQTREADIKEAIALAVSTVNADLADNITADKYTAFDLTTICKAINDDKGTTGTATPTATPNGTNAIDYKYGNKTYTVSVTLDSSNKTLTIGTISEKTGA